MNTLRNCNRCGGEIRAAETQLFCVTCNPSDRERPVPPSLTFRERQIVGLIQQAKSNRQIACELHLTEGTVKEYLNRIYRKLGVGSRTQLAIWAFRQREAA